MDHIEFVRWLQSKLIDLAMYREDDELQRQVEAIDVTGLNDVALDLYATAMQLFLYEGDLSEDERAYLDLDGNKGWRRLRYEFE